MKNEVEKAIRYKGISFHYREAYGMEEEQYIHTGIEIIWLINGSTKFTTALCNETVGDGTLIIIPPRIMHRLDCEKEGKCKYVTINVREYTDERIYLLENMEREVIFTDAEHPYIKTLREITEVLREKDESIEVKTWLYCTCLAMFARMRMNGDCFGRSERMENHSVFIKTALDYIETHLTDDINVNSIANTLNVSNSTLTHSFKKEVGVSVYKYLTQKRLILASGMLANGIRPTEVYHKCGFKDYPNFYRLYRQMFGITPTGKVSKSEPPTKTIKPIR